MYIQRVFELKYNLIGLSKLSRGFENDVRTFYVCQQNCNENGKMTERKFIQTSKENF